MKQEYRKITKFCGSRTNRPKGSDRLIKEWPTSMRSPKGRRPGRGWREEDWALPRPLATASAVLPASPERPGNSRSACASFAWRQQNLFRRRIFSFHSNYRLKGKISCLCDVRVQRIPSQVGVQDVVWIDALAGGGNGTDQPRRLQLQTNH
jgi:hypothetical protein